jgi:hypothetical protein
MDFNMEIFEARVLEENLSFCLKNHKTEKIIIPHDLNVAI